jgi:hypothetical protein
MKRIPALSILMRCFSFRFCFSVIGTRPCIKYFLSLHSRASVSIYESVLVYPGPFEKWMDPLCQCSRHSPGSVQFAYVPV